MMVHGILRMVISGPSAFAAPEHSEATYYLQISDTVRIEVLREPDLSIEQQLDAQGTVKVPLLGNMKIAGKSIDACERLLEDAFVKADILLNPQINVSIIGYATQTFYIFGEVNRPGVKTLPPGRNSIDIFEAISLGGELTRYARRNEIRIQSQNNGNSTEVVINLDSILDGTSDLSEPQYRVQPGDIVVISERLF
jgi:polysaccharide export outer membrane protein